MNPSLLIGCAAAAATIAIGVGWQLATRAGVTSTLAPIDLSLFRYCIPALLLAPIWWRRGVWPKTPHRADLPLMLLGAGLPFGLLGMAGAQFAPAAHMGALMSGSIPLFVALLAAAFLGERFSTRRKLGYALIVLGIFSIAGPALLNAGSGAWRGDLLFLCASILWAVYTLAYRRSGISPWHSIAVLAFWSAIGALPAWFLIGNGRLMMAPFSDLGLQAVLQGVLAGVLGSWTYALAVRHLGAGSAAATAALVPVFSLLGGWLILKETPDLPTVAGALCATIGVALATIAPPARRN